MASDSPLPEPLVEATAAALEALGNVEAMESFRRLVAATDTNGGGGAFLELAAMALESEDQDLTGAIGGLMDFILDESEPPEELVLGFLSQLSAPDNSEVMAAFEAIVGEELPPPNAFVADLYAQAFNSGDIAALSELYAESVTLSIGQVGAEGETRTFTGREEVLARDREAIERGTQIDFFATDFTETGAGGEFFTFDDQGESLSGTLEVTVENGRIIGLVFRVVGPP